MSIARYRVGRADLCIRTYAYMYIYCTTFLLYAYVYCTLNLSVSRNGMALLLPTNRRSMPICSFLLLVLGMAQIESKYVVSALSSAACPQSCCFFLDTAVESEWRDLLPLGIFRGITTNPTLLERANQPCTIEAVQRLAGRALSEYPNYCQEFMCQAWGPSADAMYNCGVQLSAPDRKRIVVKVPVTPEGTKAAKLLVLSGVRVCLTACYSSHQALIACAVGAEYIAPYLGRMTDAGKNGIQECLTMQQIANSCKTKTRILVASIRDVQSMVELAARGLETFTFSPQVARALFMDSLTDEAAQDFELAAERGGRD